MFLWPETVAGRGSSEIGSCLLKYFETANVTAKKLVVYSDNCSGQNKNFNTVGLWQYLVSSGKFDEVCHTFPVPGHTMMPCDRDFGDTERKLRKKQCIYSPSQYIEIISECRPKNPFTAIEMTCEDFVNIGVVTDLMTRRSVTTENEKIDFCKISQMRIRKDYVHYLDVKSSHYDAEEWKTINLQKRGRPANIANVVMPKLNSGPLRRRQMTLNHCCPNAFRRYIITSTLMLLSAVRRILTMK